MKRRAAKGRFVSGSASGRSGFTLIEMLVVIGILGVLLTTLLLYTKASERQVTLYRNEEQVLDALTRAKQLSLAAFGQPGFGSGKTGVPCGYGVHFDAPNTFFMFKDMSGSTGLCDSADHRYSGPGELFGAPFTLDPAISFSILSASDILFLPPNPQVVMTPDAGPNASALIEIKTVDGSTARIKVTTAGQITTQ